MSRFSGYALSVQWKGYELAFSSCECWGYMGWWKSVALTGIVGIMFIGAMSKICSHATGSAWNSGASVSGEEVQIKTQGI